MNEARITVNGQELSEAEAMALRVAVSNFASEMSDPLALGDDETGMAITAGYHRNIRKVEQLIIEACNANA